MKIIVMKFGGTSVRAKNMRSYIFKHIIRENSLGYKILVVVSAIGRLGEPYSTDTLRTLVSDDISSIEMDRLLSCGEIISSIVLSDFLKENGMTAMSLAPWQIGIRTDNNFGNSNILSVDPSLILDHFKENDVLVVPGFIGITDNGHVSTLGRGGSDLSTIVLAKALQAKYVDLYSDVEGVMTADPKYDKRAKLIKEISYDRLINLATENEGVIQLKAIKYAKEEKINLRFRSTMNDYIGTYVFDN